MGGEMFPPYLIRRCPMLRLMILFLGVSAAALRRVRATQKALVALWQGLLQLEGGKA